MKSAFAFGSTLALGLALWSASPALAQKTTVKAKNDKVKTKVTSAAGATIAKSKVTVASAPAPQPTPAVASAPQIVMAAAPAPVALTTPAPAAAPVAEAPAGWLLDLGAAQAQAKALIGPYWPFFRAPTGASPALCTSRKYFPSPSLWNTRRISWCWPTSISHA